MRTLDLIAFFVSGFTSLVLETLWVRLLTLVFGGTTLAIVTVLTAFMGGLALGSLVAGKMADRIKHHVMLYGILELCIAVYALALPFFIDL
jgi:MFS family permease